ncbi:MAG: sugar phosphate isomerase/epimerase [Planctomycetia bacterium]|nr:sugar phosphate isomerase/epimerase [Planctomycetia bacterium]
MIVAATTNCFSKMPTPQALERIADLEYSHVELMFCESNDYLKPSVVVDQLRDTAHTLRNMYRLSPVAFGVDIDEENTEEYVRQFVACVKLARVMQVVTLSVRPAPGGFPFNSEVERLRICVAEAAKRGIEVGITTERGRLTEDIASVKSLCRLVPGLRVTLDPSHFIYKGNEQMLLQMESLFDLTLHVRLRDSKKGRLQVCIGQGDLEFGHLVGKLENKGYRGALSVDIIPSDDLDVAQELRKMRLFLESLL